MSRIRRIRGAFLAAWRSFLRRRTAVFFTFVFPLLIVLIFGVLVGTQPAGGLFAKPTGWYVPGYLAVVVLFTPLSRVGSEVARHRAGNRFEKLATTPLSRAEWLFAGTLVNAAVIGAAGLLLLALLIGLAGVRIPAGPALLLLIPYVAVGVALFCGVGAVLGSLADSQDGVIAASNGIALPLLFLSETFIPPALLPPWLPTGLSPLTYFSRGVRALTFGGARADPLANLAVLAVLAAAAVLVGARTLPTTD